MKTLNTVYRAALRDAHALSTVALNIGFGGNHGICFEYLIP